MGIVSPVRSNISQDEDVIGRGVPVYLMAGQSNCTGLGIIASAPAKYQGVIPESKIWNGSAWANLQAGVNNDAASGTQFGPELSFMTDMSENTSKSDIRIVKYQASGKNLAVDFLPTSGANYIAMIAKFDAAIANLVAANVRFYIAGFIWIQGENDAVQTVPAYAAAYNTNLTSLITNIRTKYNAQALGRLLPVAIAQLGSIARVAAGEWYFTDQVRQAQIDVAAAMPAVRIARTDDLVVSDANVHYDTASYITLGNRLAQAARGASSYVENRPVAFSNLTIWLDPDCPFTSDASAMGYLLSRATAKIVGPAQSTAGKKPTLLSANLNGRKTMSFDGGDVLEATYAAYSMLDFFATNQGTVIVLLNRAAVTQGQFFNILRSTSGNVLISIWNDGNIYFDFGSSTATGRVFATIPADLTGNWYICEFVRRSDGSQAIIFNGVTLKEETGKSAVLSAGTGNLTMFIGAATSTPTLPFNGRIAELMTYNKALSAAERTAEYAYLAAKWGTTIQV